MANKDKYDLRELSVDIEYKVNGCGKKLENTRQIVIKYKGKTIQKKQTMDAVIPYLLGFLEEDSD